MLLFDQNGYPNVIQNLFLCLLDSSDQTFFSFLKKEVVEAESIVAVAPTTSFSVSLIALIKPLVMPLTRKPLPFISSCSFSAISQSKAFKQRNCINLSYSSTLRRHHNLPSPHHLNKR